MGMIDLLAMGASFEHLDQIPLAKLAGRFEGEVVLTEEIVEPEGCDLVQHGTDDAAFDAEVALVVELGKETAYAIAAEDVIDPLRMEAAPAAKLALSARRAIAQRQVKKTIADSVSLHSSASI